MKVLIAEDDPVACRVLEATLVKLGYEPVIATDGKDAWTIIKAENLRIVVSDWLMPRLDGLDLCRRIRIRGGDYVYFILVTGQTATEENMKIAADAGVDDFLSKPVRLQDLWVRLRVAERILGFTTQVKELESYLPICGYCRKVRDDKNYWQQIEQYIGTRTGTSFSHGICPECLEKVRKSEFARTGIAGPPNA